MHSLFDPSSYETISVEVKNNVGIVTLNRPDVLHAFNDTMCNEVQETWKAFREIDEVHSILLTASGDKAFCVGIDRGGQMPALEDTESLYGTSNNYMYDDPGDTLGPKSCDLWKPVICAVNGMCCGGPSTS